MNTIKMEMKNRRDALVQSYQSTATTAPSETVTALVSRLGVGDAKMAIAEAVNACGAWDGRISASSREWAAQIAPEDYQTRDGQDSMYLYYPTEIHPAHLNQLAVCAMDLPEETPDETPDETMTVELKDLYGNPIIVTAVPTAISYIAGELIELEQHYKKQGYEPLAQFACSAFTTLYDRLDAIGFYGNI